MAQFQNYDFDDMQNLGFSSLPQKLISNYSFLMLLPMIKSYKTHKCTKLYYYYEHDLIKILGIMAVQIWLKISIFLEVILTLNFYPDHRF